MSLVPRVCCRPPEEVVFPNKAVVFEWTEKEMKDSEDDDGGGRGLKLNQAQCEEKRTERREGKEAREG